MDDVHACLPRIRVGGETVCGGETNGQEGERSDEVAAHGGEYTSAAHYGGINSTCADG